MERSCPLSRFRPLIPVHAIFDLEFLSLFVLYLTVRWTPLLGDLLALGFFPTSILFASGESAGSSLAAGLPPSVGAPVPAGPPPPSPVQPGGLRPSVPPRLRPPGPAPSGPEGCRPVVRRGVPALVLRTGSLKFRTQTPPPHFFDAAGVSC